ncbi:MAG: trypsin-like peptidase domain-containing protein [Candidatus Dormibacteraeota bacterium]|nr:trypsin-like peptidase domain-containing protein [Candidatus Dormibacteraeota bacterium]
MVVAALSPQLAWARRPSAKRAAVAAVVAVVVAAGVAGALAAGHGTLSRIEAATLSITARDAGGVESAGTGMTLTAAGMVLTSDRIVENADTIAVRVPGRSGEVAASIVGLDPVDDVAVIQLQGTSAVAMAPVGASASVAVGEHVSAISAQGGTSREVQGSIVALRRDVLVLSSTMHGLGSGEPVVDSSGDVIAISVAPSAGSGSAPAAAGALRIGSAFAIVQDMLTGRPNANVLHGASSVLGVYLEDSAAPQGARVVGTAAGSPARAVGLVAGDVIERIGGTRVASAAAVPEAMRGLRVGDAVRVQWVTAAGDARSATILIAGGTAR